MSEYARVTVTPALAAEWLATSKGNRQIKPAAVALLMREIQEGRWVPDSGVIRFDRSGALIDGHHRLKAIVRSSATVDADIARGCSDESRLTIDVGVARSPYDISTMRGDTRSRQWIAALNGARIGHVGMAPRVSIIDYDTLGAALEKGVERAFVLSLIQSAFDHRLPRSGHVAGILAWLLRTEPALRQFAIDVASANGRDGEPAKAVSNYLLRTRATETNNDVVARICSGADSFLSRSKLAHVKVNETALAKFRERAELWWPL